jgi:hypothetical protein
MTSAWATEKEKVCHIVRLITYIALSVGCPWLHCNLACGYIVGCSTSFGMSNMRLIIASLTIRSHCPLPWHFANLQNHNEVLRCFVTIRTAYPSEIFNYLLHVRHSIYALFLFYEFSLILQAFHNLLKSTRWSFHLTRTRLQRNDHLL